MTQSLHSRPDECPAKRHSVGRLVGGRRPKAIIVRHELTEEDKAKLRKVARELGYRGLRELLQHRGTFDL